MQPILKQLMPPIAGVKRRPRIHRSFAGLAVTLSFLFGYAAPGISAEWTLAPDISVGTIYNDNNRLSETGDEIVVWGGFADITGIAERRTELSTTSIRPRIVTSRFPGDEDEDATNLYLDFFNRTRGERHEWDWKGNFARAETLRAQRVDLGTPDPDLDNDEIGETGRVNVRRTRTIARLAPRFIYDVSERTSGGVGLDYMDVSYNREDFGEAVDYNNARAELFMINRVSPVSRLRTTVFGTRYESDAVNNDSSGYGVRGRYEYDIAETTRLFLDIGAQRTTVEAGPAGQGIDITENGFLLDVGMTRRWELTRLWISGGRSIQPTGSGFLREADQFRINVLHQVSPRWYVETAGYALRSRSVDDVSTSNDRDYFEISATLGHELTRVWSLEATAGHRRQDFKDTPGEAEVNELRLNLRYRPRGQVWSQ